MWSKKTRRSPKSAAEFKPKKVLFFLCFKSKLWFKLKSILMTYNDSSWKSLRDQEGNTAPVYGNINECQVTLHGPIPARLLLYFRGL